MRKLQDLEIFVRTADEGSLSAVASAGLKRLEGELGVPLFARSTRSLRLTPAGERFLAHARLVVDTLREAADEAGAGRGAVRGRLQITMPSDLGRNQVLGWLDEFQERYPDIHLRVHISDRVADLFRQPIDIAIRYGALPDSSLVALPLAPGNRRILCAAPSYLQRHGTPATPEELGGHNCLCFIMGDAVNDRWRFFRDGRELQLRVRGNRLTDDADAVRRWAVAGRGITYKSLLDVAPDLAAGRLVRLCPDWQGEALPLSLMCASRRQLSPTLTLLHQFLRERCTQGLQPWLAA